MSNFHFEGITQTTVFEVNDDVEIVYVSRSHTQKSKLRLQRPGPLLVSGRRGVESDSSAFEPPHSAPKFKHQ